MFWQTNLRPHAKINPLGVFGDMLTDPHGSFMDSLQRQPVPVDLERRVAKFTSHPFLEDNIYGTGYRVCTNFMGLDPQGKSLYATTIERGPRLVAPRFSHVTTDPGEAVALHHRALYYLTHTDKPVLPGGNTGRDLAS